MKLLKSTLTFSAFTLFSRVSGYARDVVQSAVFGVSPMTDAFLVAYRIPNFLRRIFAEGSFQQAFIPVFSQMKQQGDARALKQLLDHVAGALCAMVLIASALGVLLAPLIAALFAPGALDEPEKYAAITRMLRITFPFLFFISLTSLAAGVLNSYGRFAVPALTPILHNLAMICAALYLAPHFNVPIDALAWGVLLAGFLQMATQWAALARLGLVPRFRLAWNHPGIRRILRLMVPTIFGSSVAQVNLLVGTLFASLLANGSQTWLYLTDRLMEFPQGLFGVALATVILPTLSRSFAAQDHTRFADTLGWGLRLAILIALPATAGLIVLAEPLTATLYQYGKFTEHDTHMAALSLIGLAAGLPGFMVAKVLAPAFFAVQDTRTPVRAATLTVLCNVLLCCLLVAPLWYFQVRGAHAGIALATALAGTLHATLLWVYLKRREPALGAQRSYWVRHWLRAGIATAAMSVALLLLKQPIGPWSALPVSHRLWHLSWLIGISVAVYGAVLLALGLRPRDLRE